MKFLIFSSCFFVVFSLFGQDLTGPQLLDKAINYHDPNGNWNSFDGRLFVSMESPGSSSRDSEIQIKLPESFFYVKAIRDSIKTEYMVYKDTCQIAVNGKANPSEALLKKHNLSCERANLFKNYYTYLYGLPMKLKDPGTIISEKVERKNFQNKEYLVLRVSYEEAIGSDTWFFYFDLQTYAMEVYQFFKGDPNGSGKDTGEYILLSEELLVNDIKMPKNRAWYYNKDNKYLGTDILKQSF